jgi:hypothetical protein
MHEICVHWNRMKNITLSANEDVIEQARTIARSQHKTLNQAFREWLDEYTARGSGVREYRALMRHLRESGVRAGRSFTREEMNERR